MKKRVYIAGPISKGPLQHNIDQATAAFVALAKAGLAPFCPHWSVYAKPTDLWEVTNKTNRSDVPEKFSRLVVTCEATIHGNEEMMHSEWLGIDLPWVAVSDAVLRLPGDSVGADMETTHAATLGIPVFAGVEAVVAWAAGPVPPPTPQIVNKPPTCLLCDGERLVGGHWDPASDTIRGRVTCPECRGQGALAAGGGGGVGVGIGRGRGTRPALT